MIYIYIVKFEDLYNFDSLSLFDIGDGFQDFFKFVRGYIFLDSSSKSIKIFGINLNK